MKISRQRRKVYKFILKRPLKERRAVIKEVSKRYKKVKKKEKGKILDEFVKLTEYNRCYASYLLRSYEKKISI